MILRLSAAGRTAETHIEPSCGGRVEQIRLHPEGCSSPLPILEPERPESKQAESKYTNSEHLDSEIPATFRNPESCATEGFNGYILLPFNDRIPGGTYRWEESEMQLPVNAPNGRDAIHGFLYSLPMEHVSFESRVDILSENVRRAGYTDSENYAEAAAELTTGITPEMVPGYPFRLSVRLTYRLRLDQFFLDIEVRNTGSTTAPLSFGWHPYFRLPETSAIDQYQLQVPSDHYVEVDSMLLPTERTPSVEESVYDFRTPAALNSAELDIAIHKTANPLLLSNAMYTLELSSSEAFSYWQLFTPPGRRSIAVEPITAATDAFNRPSLGLKKLEPGDSYSGSIAVRMLR